VAALALPTTATAAWESAGPDARISELGFNSAEAEIVDFGGTPWITYEGESSAGDGVSVHRLSTAGTGFELVGQRLGPTAGSDNALANVDGVPWVAWVADTPDDGQLRLNRWDGTDWVAVAVTDPALNQDPAADVTGVSATSIGGRPWVTWLEGGLIRVVRLNDAGTGWQQVATAVGGGAGNIDGPPVIASVGGVAHVAWGEAGETHVVRLSADGTSWATVGGGPVGTGQIYVHLVDVDGVPWVTWSNPAGFTTEAAYLDAAGTAWVSAGSPIDSVPGDDTYAAGLSVVDGVPVVGWTEYNGANSEMRVARYDGDTGEWVEPVGGGSPINADETFDTFAGTVGVAGGVPWTVWQEINAASETIIHAKRLVPSAGPAHAFPLHDSAVLLATVDDYGLSLPFAFEYGSGTTLDRRTPQAKSGGLGTGAVAAHVTGLAPSTAYSQRAVSFDGVRPFAPGPGSTFTTLAAPAAPGGGGGGSGAGGGGGGGGGTGGGGGGGTPPPTTGPTVTVTKLVVAAFRTRISARIKKSLTFEYVSTAAGRSTLEVYKGRTRVARVTGSAKLGVNKLKWNGKRGRKWAGAGTYSLRLVVTGGDGQTARATARASLKRR
jgi:hypothetical protein